MTDTTAQPQPQHEDARRDTSSVRILVISALSFIAGLALVAVAAVPLSLRAQAVLVATLLLIMVIIKIGSGMDKWRLLFMVLGGFVVARYIIWRTIETIPFEAPWPTFIPGILLYFAEIYAILVLLIGFFSIARPARWRTPDLPADPDSFPTVDVFVPTYNEDPELLQTTLAACRQMRYPEDKLRVYLLDDGGTAQKCEQDDPDAAREALERRETLQALCDEMGCHYITREKNERAKAGNLNNAFWQTDGELLAVFDADHVPSAAFLEHTVGHFLEDPDLFLAQTPHFFLNKDPQERNLGTYARQHSEHEMFYHTIQPGLDNWNATFFCGSAALLRREPLRHAEGFSGASITEDCESALNLHAMGYNSRYIDIPLIAGLQPESLKDFIKQRTRWAQGMAQIFMFNNPMFKRGLRLGQRFCYTSSMVFWMFPFARLTMVLAPLVFLFFGFEIYQASVKEFLVYTLPGLISVLMVANFLYGLYRPPLISELYEFIQCTFLSRALLHVLLNPRRPQFAVTPKGESMQSSHISPVAAPLLVLTGLMFIGLVLSVWRLATQPDLRDVYAIVSGWNLFNLVIALAALGVVLEQPQRRKMPRVAVNRQAVIRVDDLEVPALIVDASATGAYLRVRSDAGLPELDSGDFVKVAPMGAPEDQEDGGPPLYAEAHVDLEADTLSWDPAEAGAVHGEGLEPDADANGPVGLEIIGVRAVNGEVEIRGQFAPACAAEQGVIVGIVYSNYLNWVAEMDSRTERGGFMTGFGRFVRLSLASAGRFVRHFFAGRTPGSRAGSSTASERERRAAGRT